MTETIRAAARVFLNGDEVICMGNPTKTRPGFVPSSKYSMAFSKSKEGIIELIIQVSSYEYNSGGILKNIKFGTFDTITRHVHRERAIEAFAFATSFIVGIIFLVVYLLRGYEAYHGYFSLGNIFMAFYLSTLNNQLLSLFFEYDLILRLRIQLVATLGINLCLLRFIHHFLRDFSNKQLVKILSIIILAMFLLVVNDPTKPGSIKVKTLQVTLSIVIIIVYSYISWVLLKAIRDRSIFLKYIILIFGALTTYWLTMISKMLFEVNLNYLPIYLILFTVMNIVLLINDRLYVEFLEVSKLTEERLEQEFKYFYSQISPHFLYNTINTIIALSYQDSEKTRKALSNLSVYFRGKLELHLEKGLIPLEEELDMVIAYLEMEKLRYGDKLKVELDIEEGLVAMIPPLTLQPLVENAVNHGIRPKEGPGTIKLIARLIGQKQIEITIEDDGVGMSAEKKARLIEGDLERLGFKNVNKRMRMLKGFSVHVHSALNVGTTIEIFLPGVKGYEDFDKDTRTLKAKAFTKPTFLS